MCVAHARFSMTRNVARHVACHGEAGKLELLGTEIDVEKLSRNLTRANYG